MPEGPEIRLAADQVAAAIQDRKTSRVFFAFDHLKPYETMLTGRTVTAIDTRGKAMLRRLCHCPACQACQMSECAAVG